jgi:hypothetical protein
MVIIFGTAWPALICIKDSEVSQVAISHSVQDGEPFTGVHEKLSVEKALNKIRQADVKTEADRHQGQVDALDEGIKRMRAQRLRDGQPRRLLDNVKFDLRGPAIKHPERIGRSM